MTLPSSGTISINDLKTEFNDTTPSSMNEFYRGGTLVPNIPANNSIPTAGTIALNDFYGATAQGITFNLGSDETDASLSTYYYRSSAVSYVPTGGATISITGGAYRYYNGTTWSAFTTSTGTFLSTYTQVEVRLASSSSYGTTTTATLTIGGVSDSFSVTTQAADTIPNTFELGDPVTGQALSSYAYSNIITVSGLSAGVSVSASVSGSGTEMSINSAAYTSTTTNVANNDTIRIRVLSSSNYSTQTSGTLNINGITDTFYVTTQEVDTTPDPFNLGTNVTNATVDTNYYSNIITVAGLSSGYSTSVTISGTGASYSKNGGAYTTSLGTVINNDTIRVKILSSSNYSTTYTATLNIGGVTDSWSVTTEAADTIPDSFSFSDVGSNAYRNTVYTSNTITVSGLSSGISTSVTVSGGTYSKNGGGYTSSSGTAVNGDTFTVRLTTSSSYSTTSNCTLSIGGVSDTYSVTTLPQLTSSSTFPGSKNIHSYTVGSYNSEVDSGTATSSISISVSANSTSVSMSVSASGSASGGSINVAGTPYAYSASASGAIASYYLTINPSSITLNTSGAGEDECTPTGTDLSYPNQTVTVPSSDSGSFSIEAPALSWALGTSAYTYGARTYTLSLTVTDIEGSSVTALSSFSTQVSVQSSIEF